MSQVFGLLLPSLYPSDCFFVLFFPVFMAVGGLCHSQFFECHLLLVSLHTVYPIRTRAPRNGNHAELKNAVLL